MSIKPQPGFQTDFLACSADIAIGGGAAGVGKTFAELMEPLYHKHVKGFDAIFFRRTSVQIRNPGGLWDKSLEMYSRIGGTPREQQMDWKWGTGAGVKFSHLEHESNIYDHQGTEYCLIIFDELTHFTKKMFFYMLTRNRSMCGVKPYMRATCNPDPDSFVAELIEWYIDQETGYPIPERAGVLRYFVVDNEEMVWGDSKDEVLAQVPHLVAAFPKTANPHDFVKSFTFIPGDIYENQKLLETDPGYLANLMAQDEDEKARLLGGNWKKRTDNKSLFNYESVDQIFTNEFPGSVDKRRITVDAARFGRDFMTLFVWYGWRVVKLVILTQCDDMEAIEAIETERIKFKIVKGNVLVDQDGVGGSVVRKGGYKGFSGGAPPIETREIKDGKENFANRKTQCYYRFADRVNNGEVSVSLDNGSVLIDGVYGVKMKYRGKVVDVRDLIKQDLRAIKKKELDPERKFQINSKEEQKVLLKGRSPDFGDGMSIVEQLELTGINLVVSTPTNSILDMI